MLCTQPTYQEDVEVWKLHVIPQIVEIGQAKAFRQPPAGAAAWHCLTTKLAKVGKLHDPVFHDLISTTWLGMLDAETWPK